MASKGLLTYNQWLNIQCLKLKYCLPVTLGSVGQMTPCQISIFASTPSPVVQADIWMYISFGGGEVQSARN